MYVTMEHYFTHILTFYSPKTYLSSTTVSILIMIVSILKWFLKNIVTLKTGVMVKGIKCFLTYIKIEISYFKL